ncbi:MAG TPA: DNA primase [Mycobacteriales bacterium]|nr:DNA primase [Mycobacteriales bacterium]
MAGRIRDADVVLVRERARIDEVIGERLQLRPAGGGRLKGLCPFHDEKSPSFYVTPTLGFYYCFGCTASGDVITFLRDSEHLSFVEAVEMLAGRYGVQLTYEQGSAAPGRQSSQRTRLVEANRAATAFYTEQLSTPGALAAQTFLAERGFDRDAATTYGLGYAPEGWDLLVKALRSKGFSAEELLAAGLASQGRQGPIDRFRHRLVWPIRDLTGEVVGFGARKLSTDPGDDSPKYLNTPETPLYKKSQVLYGLEAAKKEIARRRQAVVVEGYTDVMACHLAGVPTAVATCGTAFGSDHISVLRRLLMDSGELRGEVVFLFDGDAAGQKAALKAFDSEQEFVAQTFVAVSPGGSDPCELRLARGDAAVRDLVASRVPLVEFALQSVLARYDLETAEGRVAALSAAAPLVAKIKDRALRPEYARRLSGWLGMDAETVLSRVAELTGETRAPRQRGPAARRPADAAALAVEREALKLAVQVPVLVAPLFDAIDGQAWTDEPLRAVRELIGKVGGTSGTAGGESWVAALREAADEEPLRTLVTVLAVEPLHSDLEPDSRYAGAVLSRLQEFALSRRMAELKPQLQRINPAEEPERYGRAFAELVQLEQSVRALRERGAGQL